MEFEFEFAFVIFFNVLGIEPAGLLVFLRDGCIVVIEFKDGLAVLIRPRRPPAFGAFYFKTSREFDAFYPVEDTLQNSDANTLVLEADQILMTFHQMPGG